MNPALADLRRTRRRRRLGDTEWFDLAYRVYLAAFFGGAAIIILSDFVGDAVLSERRIADVVAHGPTWIGVLVAAAVAIGARGGAAGGPVTVESADVQHLLLAPVSRTSVLRRPLWQRIRAVGFGAAVTGGVAGLLAEQRVPSSAGAWVWWGAVFGAAIGALTVAVATLAHATRLRGWQATLLGGGVVGLQGWAATGDRTGPFDGFGRIAFRDVAARQTDLIWLVVVGALVAAAQVAVGRLRPEQLARRGALVSQLRFAVTMQDLRTVVLLRRQLNQERSRPRPWLRLGRGDRDGHGAGRGAVRRGVQGVMRTPASRFGRLAALAAVAGAAAGAGAAGTTPAFGAAAIVLFVLGLDLIEPLSQEIDHPDRTAALPCDDGWLHVRLLAGPAAVAVPLAFVGAAACIAVEPDSAAAALVLCVPVVWCGMVGAVVNAVRDLRDPAESARSYELVVPPEVSGVQDVVRLVWPVLVSSVGMVAAFAVREQPGASTVLRAMIGLVLWLGFVRWWIVHRNAVRRRWREFAAGAA